MSGDFLVTISIPSSTYTQKSIRPDPMRFQILFAVEFGQTVDIIWNIHTYVYTTAYKIFKENARENKTKSLLKIIK